jgi:aerobic carbon-monoxide dehydrogenase large subunit
MGAKHFGARIARLEDPALLTGQGRFVDDIELSGVLHAAFVRSPHAHPRQPPRWSGRHSRPRRGRRGA